MTLKGGGGGGDWVKRQPPANEIAQHCNALRIHLC